MTIPDPETVKTAEEAHDLAVEWQHWASQQSMSYGELADWEDFFILLGERFDLTEEFKDNAVIGGGFGS